MSSNADETTAALRRSARAARRAGMSAEQWGWFIDAGYIMLTEKAMRFHVMAERADFAGQPNLIMLGGGRGGSKSHQEWMQIVRDCDRHRGIVGRYIKKVGKSAKSKMEKLIKKTLSNVPHEWKPSEGILYIPSKDDPNPSQILVGYFSKESDIEVEQGDEFDFVLLEEAGFLPRELITLIFGQVRTTNPTGWRPRGYANSNPGGVGNQWILEHFVIPSESGRHGDFIGKITAFIHSTYKDNPVLEMYDPDYKLYLESLTGILYKLWTLGDYHNAGGIYFANFSLERHVLRPFPIPAHWKMWWGFDYGRSHPQAVYLATKDPETKKVYCIAEHFKAGLIPEEHAPYMHDMATGQGRKVSQLPPLAAGPDVFAKGKDPKGGTIAGAYKKLGFRMKPANTARVTGAAKMARMLGSEGDENGRIEIEPMMYFFDTCPHIIEQMQKMQADPNHLEDVKKVNANAEGRGGDDGYDAWRYTVMEDVEKVKTAVVPSVIMRAGYR